MNYIADIKSYIALEQEILSKLDIDTINEALNLLDETRLKKGRTISAATAAVQQRHPISRTTLTRAFLNTSTFRSALTA